MRCSRKVAFLTFFALSAALYGQTVYVEMAIRGPERLSTRENGFIRATADGLLETLWEAGFIVYDSGDPASRRQTHLPNVMKSARDGGAQLLLLVELETVRGGAADSLTATSFNYRLMSVRDGSPVESGTAQVAGLLEPALADREVYWTDHRGGVEKEELHAQYGL